MTAVKSKNLKLNTKYIQEYGFSINSVKEGTAHYISDVKNNGMAMKAGLKNGDRITMINDQAVKNIKCKKLMKLFKKHKNITLFQIERNETLTVNVKESSQGDLTQVKQPEVNHQKVFKSKESIVEDPEIQKDKIETEIKILESIDSIVLVDPCYYEVGDPQNGQDLEMVKKEGDSKSKKCHQESQVFLTNKQGDSPVMGVHKESDRKIVIENQKNKKISKESIIKTYQDHEQKDSIEESTLEDHQVEEISNKESNVINFCLIFPHNIINIKHTMENKEKSPVRPNNLGNANIVEYLSNL